MSNLSAHCRECFYEKTHTENDHPCSNCYGGDECLDKRIPELQAQVAKMQLENLSLRLALTHIASIPMLLACQNPGIPKAIAERALKDLPPT